MKNKFYVFIISFLIFACAFYFNVSSSYASGVCFSTPYTFINHDGDSYTLYTCTTKSDITTSFTSAIAFARWGYIATKDTCYIVIVNNVTHNIASYSNDRGRQFSVPSFYPADNSEFYSDLSSALSALSTYVPTPPTSYDDTIGIGGKFWLLQSGGISNQMTWGAMWNYDDIRTFQLTIIGSKKTDKFDFTDNGGYWFNPFDYGVLGEQITLYLTPFDNNGNWGNTLTLSKGCYFDLADAIAQPFQGYVRKATNDVDIIGIDDTEVITIVEKPDTTPITNPTVVTSTIVFSPVYQTTNQQSVITYVENNYYTSNDYSTTINNIDKHTEFNINIDFGNDSGSNLSRWETAKSYLQDGASTIGGALDIFNGTIFAPIGTAIIIGLGVIIGLALVLVIVKLLGVIF